MTYGYARVSTNGQDLGSQEAELMAAGCAKVFKEKVSGAKADRAELTKAIRRLGPGDVLLVTRLDRLARSTRDLLNVLAIIGERKAGFRSLKGTWADTTTPHGRLMLTVLGGLAEFERELIRARTGDGRTRAKARGVKFGRPTALTPHQRQEALQRLDNGAAQADVARSFNVSQATISRLAVALTAIFVTQAATCRRGNVITPASLELDHESAAAGQQRRRLPRQQPQSTRRRAL